jgi:hypothetical protein
MFPERYELDFYISFRRNEVSEVLIYVMVKKL